MELPNRQHISESRNSKRIKIGMSWEKKNSKFDRTKGQLEERHKISLLNFYGDNP